MTIDLLTMTSTTIEHYEVEFSTGDDADTAIDKDADWTRLVHPFID